MTAEMTAEAASPAVNVVAVPSRTNGSTAVPTIEATPGERFAAAAGAADGHGGVVVRLGVHLPAAFPLFASRPRYPVRHLLKTATVTEAPAAFVHEPPAGAVGKAGTSYAATPEAAFAPRLAQARFTDLTAAVPLPAGLLAHPPLLASFVDLRVLVRLSVQENATLLHGSADGAVPGLVGLPGSRRLHVDAGLAEAVTEAAAEVEETGGSCDGIVAHPFVYWEMVRTGLLGRLGAAGITVSRTRMIPRDLLLLGDFRAAFTLLLPRVGTIALRRGAGPDGGDLVVASTQLGLAVHLPQHLMALTWGDNG